MESWVDRNLPTFASWFDRYLTGRLLWLLGCAVMFFGMGTVFWSFLSAAGAGMTSVDDPAGSAMDIASAELLVLLGSVTMLAAAAVFMHAKQQRAAALTSLTGVACILAGMVEPGAAILPFLILGTNATVFAFKDRPGRSMVGDRPGSQR